MPLPRLVLITGMICILGGLGGQAAAIIHTPLPYLLGSLFATAVLSIGFPRLVPVDYGFPQRFRILFIALIGMLIGAQVTPALLGALPRMALSMGAVVVFVVLAQVVNYVIFRRIGGYDRPTAFFSASPGGLIESIALGEAAGANVTLLVTQQFLRIIAVIGLVPLALSIWHGYPVGSAAGQVLSGPAAPLSQLPLLVLAAAAGAALGRLLRLPAWQLTGALLLAAMLSLSGHALAVPPWLVKLAQVVVGASLGMRFVGLDRSLLLRGLGLAIISVSAMLLIGGALAALILPFTDQTFEVLLITFAPGGVNEMALVALSLHANPAFVTLHHIFRITITVIGLGLMSRHLRGGGGSSSGGGDGDDADDRTL